MYDKELFDNCSKMSNNIEILNVILNKSISPSCSYCTVQGECMVSQPTSRLPSLTMSNIHKAGLGSVLRNLSENLPLCWYRIFMKEVVSGRQTVTESQY